MCFVYISYFISSPVFVQAVKVGVIRPSLNTLFGMGSFRYLQKIVAYQHTLIVVRPRPMFRWCEAYQIALCLCYELISNRLSQHEADYW